MSQADEQANENPLIVMVDESTNEKYARVVGHKGLGDNHERDWLFKVMSLEMKYWGYPGGDAGKVILTSDNERAVVAVREALAKYHGVVIPDAPAKGESPPMGQ